MAISDTNLVSDPFWLNMGAEIVYNSHQCLKDAVDRLQKTIVWIFGVYTSVTIGSIVFAKKENWDFFSLVLFGFAFLFLIIAYWLATTAAFPSPESFYGAEVESIRDAYLKSIKNGRTSFKRAVILCSIGVFFYSFALLYQFSFPALSHLFTSAKCDGLDSLHTELKKIDKGKSMYAIQINSKKNSWVNVSLVGDSTVKGAVKKGEDSFIFNDISEKTVWLRTDSTAVLHISLQLIQRLNVSYYLLIYRTDTLNNGNELRSVQQKVNL